MSGHPALSDVLQAACRAACAGTGISRSKILLREASPGSGLTIVAGVGWRKGVIGMRVATGPRSVLGPPLATGEPLIVDDLRRDPRFDPQEPLHSHRIVSVANVPIRSSERVFGLLEVDSWRRIALAGDDIDFLRSLSGLVVASLMRADFEQEGKRADQRLRRSEERLRIALGAARLGTWLRDLHTDRLTLDDGMLRLFGPERDRAIEAHPDLLEAILEEDRPAVAQAFETSVRDGVDVDTAFRVAQRDGSMRWLQLQGRVFMDAAGRPEFMAGACVDDTERREAAQRIQRDNQVKTEFLAMLAHELRSPMAPLRNAVALLDRSPDDARRRGVALGIMRRQLEHLSRLVGDLLEVSRIEQGKIDLQLATVDLREALRAAVETVQPLIEARGQRLAVDLPGSPVRIAADSVRVTQIVANLLHNAVKFTPAGGSIRLALEPRPDEVLIEVGDDGRGIAPAVLPHIFGLFEQGDTPSIDRADGGLGIGLALVHRLVSLHGGSVSAHSDGPGRGATFSVRLPVAVNPIAADQGAPQPVPADAR